MTKFKPWTRVEHAAASHGERVIYFQSRVYWALHERDTAKATAKGVHSLAYKRAAARLTAARKSLARELEYPKPLRAPKLAPGGVTAPMGRVLLALSKGARPGGSVLVKLAAMGLVERYADRVHLKPTWTFIKWRYRLTEAGKAWVASKTVKQDT